MGESAEVSGKRAICPTLWFSKREIRLRRKGLAPGPLAGQWQDQDQDTRLLAHYFSPVLVSHTVWATVT